MAPADDTPIFILVRDRLDCLRRLVAWLEGAGATRLVLLNLDSGYPPLSSYLEQCRHPVVPLDNIGSRGIWQLDLLPELADRFFPAGRQRYVVTDPDVVPTEDCPKNLLAHLHRLMDRHPRFGKIGVGLRIDDLPDCFPERDKVVAWEKQWWAKPVRDELFDCGFAGVATTFALYRGLDATDAHGDCDSARTNLPYVARHLAWYLDPANLPDDEEWYYRHAPVRRIGVPAPGVTWSPFGRGEPEPSRGASCANAIADVQLRLGDQTFVIRVPEAEANVVDEVFTDQVHTIPRPLIHDAMTVVDVGAHVGSFALYASLAFGAAPTIHCFESRETNLDLLRENLAGRQRIRIHPFSSSDGASQGSAESARAAGSAFDESGLSDIDVLKIDIGGDEPALLDALGARLARVRCVLIAYHSARDRRSIDAALAEFDLFDCRRCSVRTGLLKYLRRDLAERHF